MQAQTNWRLVWLLWGAGLGAAGQYAKISVIFDRLPEVYPGAVASLGFAVSLVGVVGIVLGVVAGVLVSKIGYRRALLGALTVGAGLSALQALWPPLPVFLGLRVLEGATHLAIVVAAPTLIAQVSAERDQGRALTLWGTFFGVAFAILAWGGVPLAARFGLSAVLLAHAAVLAGMAALLWRRLPEPLGAQSRVSLAELLRAHLKIYRSPRIGAPAIGWLFYTFCFVSVLTVLPPFLAPEWRSWTQGAMPLVSILSSMTLGVWLLRRVSAVAVVLLGFAGAVVASLGLLVWPASPLVVLAIGAAIGLTQGASFAAVPQLNSNPQDRALANGGLAQMGNLGNTAGTPVMLLVIGLAGYEGLVVGTALVFALGGVSHVWLARRRTEAVAKG